MNLVLTLLNEFYCYKIDKMQFDSNYKVKMKKLIFL